MPSRPESPGGNCAAVTTLVVPPGIVPPAPVVEIVVTWNRVALGLMLTNATNGLPMSGVLPVPSRGRFDANTPTAGYCRPEPKSADETATPFRGKPAATLPPSTLPLPATTA